MGVGAGYGGTYGSTPSDPRTGEDPRTGFFILKKLQTGLVGSQSSIENASLDSTQTVMHEVEYSRAFQLSRVRNASDRSTW